MINDLILILPVHRRRFVTHAETACLVLATIRRGVFHYVIHGECPLDYLFFPNTPFARTLSKKERLKNSAQQLARSIASTKSLILFIIAVH